MPARPQNNCYPTEGLTTNDSRYPAVCKVCNWTNKYSIGNCNASTAQTSQSTCATCNTVCQASKQAYCTIHSQYIKDHADVGPYDEICHAKDEFIFRNWTAAWWNDYQDDLLTADRVGKRQPHEGGVSFPDGRAVADPCNNNHPSGSLVTAKKYNDLANGVEKFPGASVPKVKGSAEVGCEAADVIRASHALALKTAYNNAKFKVNVCDVCNTASQFTFSCSCNCSCSCSCTCGTTDAGGCSRGCGCSCGCSCGCACSSGAIVGPSYAGINNPGNPSSIPADLTGNKP